MAFGQPGIQPCAPCAQGSDFDAKARLLDCAGKVGGPSRRKPQLPVHGRAELCQINGAGLGCDYGTGITVIGLSIG